MLSQTEEIYILISIVVILINCLKIQRILNPLAGKFPEDTQTRRKVMKMVVPNTAGLPKGCNMAKGI